MITDGSSDPADDTNETPHDQIVQKFRIHMGSLDGGSKAWPEAYSLAAKQILTACGNDIAALTKQNLYAKYVNPLLADESSLSVRTLRHKLEHLGYFCKFLLDHK